VQQITINNQILMKKLILLSILFMLNLLVSAQVPFSLTEGECAVVYALPKTELCIEVQTEKVTQKPGMFYRYSERYLATNKVITTEKTTYNLKSIAVKTHAVADPNRTYKFVSSINSQPIRLTVNAQGLLCGVNVPSKSEMKLPPVVSFPSVDNCLLCGVNVPSKSEMKLPPVVSFPSVDNSQTQTLLPLGEEYMMAGSEAKLAEGAAKQIYRIRESRVGLLTADVEKLPADGASFSSMIDGLNKMERELTELFVGKTNTEIQTQTIYLTPDSELTNHVIFRLSALRGIVASDDLSGTPFYINITPTLIRSVAADPKAKKEKVGLYTILPASTQIMIGDGVTIYFSGQYFIPQFGKIIPLSEDLFKQRDLKIRVDQQTGRVLGIE